MWRNARRWLKRRLPVPRWFGAGLIGALAVLVLAVAIWAATHDSSPKYTVVVRQGSMLPLQQDHALFVVPAATLEDLITTNLETVKQPVSFNHVTTTFGQDGIKVAGRATWSSSPIHIPVPFETVAHPVLQNGQLQVRLSDTKAIGYGLPALVQNVLQSEVNAAVTRALPTEAYGLTEIEFSPDQLFVYLVLPNGSAAKTAGK